MALDIDSEINSLLESIGFDSDNNYDFEDSKSVNKLSDLEKDYDGTPIIGKEVARKTRKRTEKSIVVKKEKKDGRGRPQNKTFDCTAYTNIQTKLGIILGVVIKKFSKEVIEKLQTQGLLEILIIPNDDYSSCDRVRMYVGKTNENAHKRDKCKGRANCYERKGVFPIVDFVYAVEDAVNSNMVK